MKLPVPWSIPFGAEPLAIPVPRSTGDAVTRLRAVVHSTGLQTMFASGLVGRVSEERVVVRFQRPWFHDSVAPHFVGSFAVVAGQPCLAGSVRLTRFAQMWLGVFFGGLLFFTLLVVPAFLLGFTEPRAEMGLLVLLVMWMAGLGILYFSWWMGQRDRAEIEKGLPQALSSVAAA